jgi:hypothetical protein
MLGAFSAARASAEHTMEETATRHTRLKENAPILLSILDLRSVTVVIVANQSAQNDRTFPRFFLVL